MVYFNLNVVKSHYVIESIFSVCFLQFSADMLLIVPLQRCVCVRTYARVYVLLPSTLEAVRDVTHIHIFGFGLVSAGSFQVWLGVW